STSTGVVYNWTALNGGTIVSGGSTLTPVVSTAGTYVLAVTATSAGCVSTDTVLVTSNRTAPQANAGPDKSINCLQPTVALNGSSTTSGATYSWSGPGVLSGGATAQPTVNVAGTYTLTVTNPANGCTATDAAVVTQNVTLPNADAGPQNALTCSILEVNLNGSSTTAGAQYSWTTRDGNIVSGQNTANPLINALGTYYLTVTDPGNGCSATDSVLIEEGPCILPYYVPCPGGKFYGKIGCELSSLYNNYVFGSDTISDIFTFANDSVFIEIISVEGYTQQLKSLIYQAAGYGLTDTIPNGLNPLIITGKYPIANLIALTTPPASPWINYVRPVYPSLNNSGIALTQGDKAQTSDIARQGFGVDGSGVKVCVLSDSYNTLPGNNANIDVLNGDLPGSGNPSGRTVPVQVIKDYPYGSRSDEGRAMLQIVHDVAPGSDLGFRTGVVSEGDLAQGIIECAQQGCEIVVDDITFITSPFYQDGVISKAVDSVASLGVTYFTSAGNFGTKSYEGQFRPMTAPLGIVGQAHDFGTNDNLLSVSLPPGNYTIVLQWQDSIYSLGQTSTGTVNDFDIYLTNQYGTKYFGFNRDNLGGDPLEVLPFIVPGTANVTANISVVRAVGSQAARFKLIVFRGEIIFNEYTSGSSTIVGQGNANGAITLGASNYFNTPAFGVNPPVVQNFSSRGGTIVNGVVRNKPDLVAPNGGNSTVNLGGPNVDGDLFPNFFGTSASAPHAAAVGALLRNGKQKFYGTDLSPAQVKSILTSTALDMVTPGFDFSSGAGLLRAFDALATFA
ncbi:MAG: S8 family serine peptidase, partial [Bacteroidota bacterium]